ncbi:hypothetical protein ACHHYP_17269 [Achlya hypogyna]|uniref:Uncharacterized protein n=1 Tax=Achlya hypogyna TaxID=1202772 RepID=A0A1V9Y4S4_ACHHY|nr:hypothetical protein ACHHYP_17269 [Achlya hypogyna]
MANVTEREALTRAIALLRWRIRALCQHRSALLSWRDVALALQDDMLKVVREHRGLRHELDAHALLTGVLKRWVAANTPADTPSAQPGWADSYLFAGASGNRRIGYKWLADQLYHNVASVFSPGSTNAPGAHFNVTCSDSLFRIQGVVTRVVTCDVATATMAYWIAERSFAHVQQAQAFVLDAWLDDDTEDVIVYGKYVDDSQATIVVRSVLQDEAHPLASGQWSVDSKQWNVIERIDDDTTRIRSAFTMGHPATKRGFVRLQEFHRWAAMPPCDKPVLVQRLQHRFFTRQHHLQRLFDTHLNTFGNDVISHYRTMGVELPKKPRAMLPPKLVMTENEYLTNYMHTLQRKLVRLQQRMTTLLPWVDVLRALADDTLHCVYANRELRRMVQEHARVVHILESWVQRSHRPASPRATEKLFAGDGLSRQIGIKWLAMQMYYHHERAVEMCDAVAALRTDHQDFDQITVNWTDDWRFRTSGVSQLVVPHALDTVVKAWRRAQDDYAALGPALTIVQNSEPVDIVYTMKETHLSANQSLGGNCIYGRFSRPHHTVLVLRTLATDELLPLPKQWWTADFKLWIVIDALNAHKSRVRVHFHLDHPCTPLGGKVDTTAVAAALGLESSATTDDIQREVQARYEEFKTRLQTYVHSFIHNVV